MKKKIKRIKETINTSQYEEVMKAAYADISIRENTRTNLLRTFTILYYTGCRINEVQEMRISHIKEMLQNSSVKIFLPKTNSERKIFVSKDFKMALLEVFDISEDSENRVICKEEDKKLGLRREVYTDRVNKFIQKVLGKDYQSHGFRRSLITDMAVKGINPKIISAFIGHKSVHTTMRYIVPSHEDLMSAMIR